VVLQAGGAEWHSFERYRGHTLRQALAITDALETLPPDMRKAGADALAAVFETDNPAGDLQKVWTAMIAFASRSTKWSRRSARSPKRS
jgi:hypothetical protein